MKKMIIAGKNFSVNTKKDEDPAIMEWLNSQSNLSDSIRFLIEQDIKLYGIRNLQQTIPAKRDFNFNIERTALNERSTLHEANEEVESYIVEELNHVGINGKINTTEVVKPMTVTKAVIDSWE